jgi:hypothetical protein
VAHCDGVKHGPGHAHCDGGEPPPPPPAQPQILVLRDGNGALIGEVVELPTTGSFVSIVYRGDPAEAAFFTDFPITILSASVVGNPPDVIWDDPAFLYFTSANCTGTPYYRESEFLIHFNLPVQLSVQEVVGGQEIYVPVDISAPPVSLTPSSSLNGGDCTVLNTQAQDLFIAAMPVNVNFVRPYTVGF